MNFCLFVFCAGLLMAGCAKTKPEAPPKNQKPPAPAAAPKKNVVSDTRPVITPDDSPSGKVLSVNKNARFVVIHFPSGNVPPVGRRLSIYHNDLKVGEIQVTGPQQDENTVANLTAGEAEVRDEVREH
jgi:hypothetical protein